MPDVPCTKPKPFKEVLVSAVPEDPSENFLLCNVTANEKDRRTMCNIRV